jgi:DNA-binding transcriptional MerR regulator
MKNMNEMTVKEMALLSGVTIRALHHYDEIGLLRAHRTQSGYRVYTEKHALRLQQILLHKSFGMSLDEIAKSLDDPKFDNLSNLQQQKKVLIKQSKNMASMIHAIDAAISQLEGTTHAHLKDIFGGFDPSIYDEEVEEKWGDTVYYKDCQQRIASYTKDDWQHIKSEENKIWQDAAEAYRSGISASSQTAFDLSDRYQHHIDRWFYQTSSASYAALADVWENDPRFIRNIDKFETGLAGWIASAVRARYMA